MIEQLQTALQQLPNPLQQTGRLTGMKHPRQHYILYLQLKGTFKIEEKSLKSFWKAQPNC